MRVRADGFVMLAVLVFLYIFSLMSTWGFADVAMRMRLNRDLWQHKWHTQTVKGILHQLEENIASDQARCLIPVMATGTLIQKPVTWWRHFSCGGNSGGNRYYYVIEFLGNDDCAILQQNNRMVTADYYRITLLCSVGKSDASRHFFQSTVIKANNEIPVCDQPHKVTAGRQMWREI